MDGEDGSRVAPRRVIATTARLVLREIDAADRDALHRVYGDPVVMAHYPAAFSPDDTAAWIRRLATDSYARDGFGLWAVVVAATGDLVGDCGLTRQTTPYGREAELGYHLRRDVWGRGYATEAARAVLAHGFGPLGLPRIVSIVAPDNRASRAVAARVHTRLETYHRPDGVERYLYLTEAR
jgi:RimJ/RimL family protein N-acetyltransferase